jgi:uncharacterized protein (TIGR02186 family)
MKTGYLSIVIGALLCVLLHAPLFAGEGIQMKVQPDTIDIDALFNGTTVTAAGTIPADSEVIVRFVGAPSDLHMKEKGKVFGLLWMNLGSLTIKDVPNVCIVCSGIDSGASDAASSQAVRDLQLAGLKQNAKIESSTAGDGAGCMEELIKLKKSEGLYREMTRSVSYGPASEGSKTFKAEVPVPSRLSPGKYTVDVAAIKDGKIIARSELPVTVKLVGAPAFLANLAFGYGAIYGILATIIAMLSGLAIGMVFQSKGAH